MDDYDEELDPVIVDALAAFYSTHPEWDQDRQFEPVRVWD